MTVYELYKIIDGERYLYGTYSDPCRLADACHFLGVSGIEYIEVKEVIK